MVFMQLYLFSRLAVVTHLFGERFREFQYVAVLMCMKLAFCFRGTLKYFLCCDGKAVIERCSNDCG